MKNIKFACVVLVMVILVGMVPTSAFAKVVNKYLYTDIVATIDGVAIRTYNIDGYTNVVAEDLRNYGFIVNWDPLRRRLDISRNPYPTITSTYKAEYVPPYKVGQKAGDVLATDINTYVEGKYIKSYNINGLTCVNIEDVAKILYCENVYNNAERRLYITRRPFPNYNNISGVRWTGSAAHLATYRELDLKVLSADASNVTFEYRLYNETSNETVSSGRITVAYKPVIFKYSFKVNYYSWDDVFKVGLATDTFVIPFSDGREFDKIRVVYGEDGVMYEASLNDTAPLNILDELDRR